MNNVAWKPNGRWYIRKLPPTWSCNEVGVAHSKRWSNMLCHKYTFNDKIVMYDENKHVYSEDNHMYFDVIKL